MRIGFYLENKNIPSVDLRHPELGNPGCGGTQFLFASLPFYLQKYYPQKCQPIIIANSLGKMPSHISCIQASNLNDAVLKSANSECDFLVYRPRRHESEGFCTTLDTFNMKAIAWAHVSPTEKHLRAIAECKLIKALVCVGGEQYDHLKDSPAYSKLTLVTNGFDVSQVTGDSDIKDSNLVIYMGALVPQKGFGVLAQAWKSIVKYVPEAKLSVIGSGSLYDSAANIGKLGVASLKYENEVLIPNLCDSKGNLLPSVTFHGNMGIEKREILQRASIGVPNPTGATETFCLSAAEMSAYRIAIVSGAYNGLLDTVKDSHTGLLGYDEEDLIDNIVYLLKNPEVARKLGNNGYRYVEENFNYQRITKLWVEMFDRLLAGHKPVTYKFKENVLVNYKWLVIINTVFQSTLGRLVPWPSIHEFKRLILQFSRCLKGVSK